jgi:hypothetical protein
MKNMKTLLVLLLLLGGFSINAQTSVIGVKSHHGAVAEIPNAPDKFGEMSPVPIYDTVIKINNKCVIQIGVDNGWGVAFRDTVCDHWYYQNVNFDVKKVQEYHGRHVKLVGFDDDESNIQQKENPAFNIHTNKFSSKWLFLFIVLAGLGVYVARLGITNNSKS